MAAASMRPGDRERRNDAARRLQGRPGRDLRHDAGDRGGPVPPALLPHLPGSLPRARRGLRLGAQPARVRPGVVGRAAREDPRQGPLLQRLCQRGRADAGRGLVAGPRKAPGPVVLTDPGSHGKEGGLRGRSTGPRGRSRDASTSDARGPSRATSWPRTSDATRPRPLVLRDPSTLWLRRRRDASTPLVRAPLTIHHAATTRPRPVNRPRRGRVESTPRPPRPTRPPLLRRSRSTSTRPSSSSRSWRRSPTGPRSRR